MNTFENKPIPKLDIETIKSLEGNEASFCPERGGITISIKFKGKEILYLDKETFNNPDKNVRGGIPVLFPNAGPVDNEKYPNLKQHGFARNKKWEFIKTLKGFIEKIKSDVFTKEVFPFEFELSMIGEFKEDGSFNLTQSVKNFEKEKEMPMSFGLHPYFKVLNEFKKDIKFNFEGGKELEDQFDIWSNDGTITIDNPGVPLNIYIPGTGHLVMEASNEYKKFCIWSQPGKDFICVEPFMRSDGGLVDDPEMIKPGQEYNANFNLKLKEEN
jgi:galactose mutarotase-like enzyme